MSPEQLAKEKAEAGLSQEEKARREKFHDRLGKLRSRNKELGELQRQQRLAKKQKNRSRALEITVILIIMLKLRGKSSKYWRNTKCQHCGAVKKQVWADVHALPEDEWGKQKAVRIENEIFVELELDEVIADLKKDLG